MDVAVVVAVAVAVVVVVVEVVVGVVVVVVVISGSCFLLSPLHASEIVPVRLPHLDPHDTNVNLMHVLGIDLLSGNQMRLAENSWFN